MTEDTLRAALTDEVLDHLEWLRLNGHSAELPLVTQRQREYLVSVLAAHPERREAESPALTLKYDIAQSVSTDETVAPVYERKLCGQCGGSGSDTQTLHQDERGNSEIEHHRCDHCDGLGFFYVRDVPRGAEWRSMDSAPTDGTLFLAWAPGRDVLVSALAAHPERPRRGCINCGDTDDGGYVTDEGEVGGFCASCWDILGRQFAPAAHPERREAHSYGERPTEDDAVRQSGSRTGATAVGQVEDLTARQIPERREEQDVRLVKVAERGADYEAKWRRLVEAVDNARAELGRTSVLEHYMRECAKEPGPCWCGRHGKDYDPPRGMWPSAPTGAPTAEETP